MACCKHVAGPILLKYVLFDEYNSCYRLIHLLVVPLLSEVCTYVIRVVTAAVLGSTLLELRGSKQPAFIF